MDSSRAALSGLALFSGRCRRLLHVVAEADGIAHAMEDLALVDGDRLDLGEEQLGGATLLLAEPRLTGGHEHHDPGRDDHQVQSYAVRTRLQAQRATGQRNAASRSPCPGTFTVRVCVEGP
jgi:hypothetical protein